MDNLMKFFTLFFCFIVFLICDQVKADSQAQSKCRSLHHMDADSVGTVFTNNNCLLTCNIHGKYYNHAVNEGQTCLLGSLPHVCKNGQCSSQYQQGHIDINLQSASLSQRANIYASVCLKNSSAPVSLPLSTNDKIGCIYCSSNVASNTNYATWNSVCTNSGNHQFINDARVTFEVWNYFGPQNSAFLGGSTLTIPQLQNHGDNNRLIHLALTGGSTNGQINVRITWTPIR